MLRDQRVPVLATGTEGPAWTEIAHVFIGPVSTERLLAPVRLVLSVTEHRGGDAHCVVSVVEPAQLSSSA